MRDSLASLHRAAQEGMKPAPPLLANRGTAFFGAENEMVVKAEVIRPLRRPARARHVFWFRFPVAVPQSGFTTG